MGMGVPGAGSYGAFRGFMVQVKLVSILTHSKFRTWLGSAKSVVSHPSACLLPEWGLVSSAVFPFLWVYVFWIKSFQCHFRGGMGGSKNRYMFTAPFLLTSNNDFMFVCYPGSYHKHNGNICSKHLQLWRLGERKIMYCTVAISKKPSLWIAKWKQLSVIELPQ